MSNGVRNSLIQIIDKSTANPQIVAVLDVKNTITLSRETFAPFMTKEIACAAATVELVVPLLVLLLMFFVCFVRFCLVECHKAARWLVTFFL